MWFERLSHWGVCDGFFVVVAVAVVIDSSLYLGLSSPRTGDLPASASQMLEYRLVLGNGSLLFTLIFVYV